MLSRKIHIFGNWPATFMKRWAEKGYFNDPTFSNNGQTADDKAREAENLKFHPRNEPRMKIKILKTADSSPDGIQVVTYKGGEIYELGQAQGSRFVRKGWAKLMEGKLSDIEDHPDIEAEKAKLKACMNAAPKKLKVKMRETHDSSPDGIHALRFREKETYELPEDLGLAFIRSGWAVLNDDKSRGPSALEGE